MKKSQLPYRRRYETRHTVASWALAAGESPEWVARTMGHVNTAMIYTASGRYNPNPTRQDGSALEGMLTKASNERQSDDSAVRLSDKKKSENSRNLLEWVSHNSLNRKENSDYGPL